MKIAKIFSGNPNNRKGQFNNCHERTKRLQEVVEVDAYLLRIYDDLLFRLVKRNFRKVKREGYTTLEGVKYKNIWLKHRLIDYVLTIRLKLKASSFFTQLEKHEDAFRDYDIISAHSMESSYLAYLINKKYDIPYSTAWHGSDINIFPAGNRKYNKWVQVLLKNAACNFFVSKKLLEVSELIYKSDNKEVLYTGISSRFAQYPQSKKSELRQKFNIKTKYVIGFIGNLVTVKNVLSLPELFATIQCKLDDVSFIIVGNGELEIKLLRKFEEYKINHLSFFGKQEPEAIPDIMNCLDVLLLPSLNEGLPRVTLEALACGVNVVGSDVGGIAESIGKENVFDLDGDFVENISNRIIEMIENNEKPKPISNEFSWDSAIEKEMNIYKYVLDKQ